MESVVVSCRPDAPQQAVDLIHQFLSAGRWLQLMPYPSGSTPRLPDVSLPEGPGVVLASGGSSGQSRLCFHPVQHLELSAQSTANWLSDIGINPSECLIFNPLPLHHISGLMGWWRSQQWGVDHIWLEPAMMKNPSVLLDFSESIKGWKEKYLLASLVPTQLTRLMEHPKGLRWLKHFAVIWVGGAPLSADLAKRAREAHLRLSPCYGATETTAMVTAQAPDSFLAGLVGCGSPLSGVELCLDERGCLKVRCNRLAMHYWISRQPECCLKLVDKEGWWTSGDLAAFDCSQFPPQLNILGRADGALNTGGETVFPERLEARLWDLALKSQLPLQQLLFVGIEESTWGNQLVALVRSSEPGLQDSLLKALPLLCKHWNAAEQPKIWLLCQTLEVNAAGKWDRSHWSRWAALHADSAKN